MFIKLFTIIIIFILIPQICVYSTPIYTQPTKSNFDICYDNVISMLDLIEDDDFVEQLNSDTLKEVTKLIVDFAIVGADENNKSYF